MTKTIMGFRVYDRYYCVYDITQAVMEDARDHSPGDDVGEVHEEAGEQVCHTCKQQLKVQRARES
jgi:hypothetical protein